MHFYFSKKLISLADEKNGWMNQMDLFFSHDKTASQPAFTCSKLTIETLVLVIFTELAIFTEEVFNGKLHFLWGVY